VADNVGYTPGTGALVAADEIAGVLHQRVKIGVGADGTAVDVSDANPMPITAPSAIPISTPSAIDVTVGNFPATQAVSGSVSVSNFPATQNVNIVGGSSGNAAASATGAAVPASADYIGINVGGNLEGVSATNPMPVLDESAATTRQDIVLLLTRMLNYFNAPMGYDKSLQRQRGTVVLESGTVTTVTTVTTCSTVTNVTSLNNLDGYNARMQILDNNRTAWAQCVRARIT
jgi:hypothetical protein